jgi:hypothetical protein
MNYLAAFFLKEQEDNAYRVYVTDTLKMIAQGNLAPAVRYADLIDRTPPDPRSGEEIAADVIRRCGLVVN